MTDSDPNEPPQPANPAGPEPAPPPPPPGPPVWPGVGAVLSGSLDLVTQSRIPLRTASLYFGVLGALTIGASILTLLAPGVDLFSDPPTGITGWTGLAWLIAALAIAAISFESDIVGIAILGGARSGRPLTLIDALRRSRQVFWRVVRASAGVGIVSLIVTLLMQALLEGIFGQATDAAPVGAAVLTSLITAPFIFVPVGIVIGDVSAWESIRRSVRLARARFRLAVVASLFSVVANFLFTFAASAGADLALRALEPFRGELQALDTAKAAGFALVSIAGIIGVFAFWSLTFTVGALATAPQVVAFLGLTGYSRGLDGAREAVAGEPARARPAWISRPMIVGIVAATLFSVLAITSTRS